MKLRDFRTEKRLTQKKLADALKVNQQTIARWEKGQTEPNIKQLRDLAMIFETSVDAILGKEKPEKLFQNFISDQSRDVNSYWGHIGINLYGVNKAKWYPITLGAFYRFYQGSGNEWTVFETLNNRYVALNRKNTRFITLSEDNAELPMTPTGREQWDLTWKEDMQSIEFYRGLAEYGLEGFDNTEVSEEYQKIINDYIKINNITGEEIDEFCHATKIYDREGEALAGIYVFNELVNIFLNLEDVLENEIITFSDEDNYFSFNASDIALIESPRLEVKERIDKYLEELER